MRDSTGNFGPEFLWELDLGKDGAYPLADGPVGLFCNAILFWRIWRCFFVMNANLLA
jgi:hypothetical protein